LLLLILDFLVLRGLWIKYIFIYYILNI
jgi:hypothetical protein